MEKFHPSTSTPKMERRIIEKNRRNHMKSLYNQLFSLLPSYSSSKEVLPVPDQVDEAINHIKTLEKKLEKCKEKKEKLLSHGKRPYSCSTSETTNSSKLITNVEVHEMGPNIDVILISGLEEQASFYGILSLLCKEGFEVVNANFSRTGNSMLQVVHEKGGKSTHWNDNSTVAKRLKELIYGYSSHGDQVESGLDLWDFEIDPDMLTYDIFDLMPTGDFCFLQQL
ncbi:hypothetical protein ACH5RR_028749 [Cinchona calisaya]|uniref:BHLH domain-containing protein n=1 Tax=Cinchona calisaya TaxID=153742 RepID=A0ABD2YQX8_9GENT